MYESRCGFIDKIVYNYRIVCNSHSHSIKTKKDKLKMCDIHRETIIKTFDIMNSISSSRKKYYIKRINIKYLKKKIIILIPDFIKKIIKRLKNVKVY